MPKIQDLYAALERADKAGDVESAREIATYIKALQPPSIVPQTQLQAPAPVAPEKAGLLRRAGDLGLGLVQGAISVPESIVGLADIPTGGRVGKALEGVGFRPTEAKEILQSYKSPEQQAAERAVQEAEGFIPTIQAAVQNPSAISNVIAQSAPSVLGGAGIARGALAVAPRIGGLAAGAIGEGAVGAGLTAEDIRAQSKTGLITPEQSAISALSGVFTGTLGALGGKIARDYLKVGDIDTILASGVTPGEKGKLLTNVIKAGLSEAALEELPQSLQEQALRNIATGRPWDEGVAEAGAMGVLAALPLGAGAGYSSYRAAERESERLDKLIKPEQARIAALKGEARTAGQYTDQLQYASAEREADIAGKAQVEAQLSAEAQAYQAQQAKVQERKGLIQEAFKADVPQAFGKTDTPEGIKDLIDNFDDYFYFKNKADADSLKKQLRQQLNETKRAQAARTKLSPEELEYTKLADVQDYFINTFGVASEPELASIPVERLQSTLNDLQAEQPTNKYVQEKLSLIESKLQQAIEVHPELVTPQQQEKVSLETERTRAKDKQEIQDEIKAREQELATITPTTEEVVNEPIPARQETLLPETVEPTAAALRGTPDGARVSETQPQRVIPSNVVPVEATTPETIEAEETQPVPLGDVGRTTGRPAGRVETREEAEPAPLIYKGASKPINTLKDAVDAVREVEAYWIAKDREAPVDLPDEFVDEFEAFKQSIPTNPKDFPVWVKEARKKVQQMKDMVDSVVAENKAMAREEDEVVGYDDLPTEPYDVNDQYLESKKAKAKGAPKQVPAKLREPTTEPVTPEDLQRTVEKWFNPVWYKQAVKNGMLNIVDGDIMDSDLPQAVKEKYQTAKALFTPQGRVYFFTKNITKGNELGVILHEIGEHKGLENLIGKQRVTQLANRVRQMAEGKGSAREVAMAKQAVELAQGEKANDKELIAYFGEIAVFNGVRPGTKGKPEFGKALAWINELWSAVTNALQKLHLNPEKVTDKDIVDMLYGAARLEMGAAQSTQEQIGEPVPNEPEILASTARNPNWELPAEVAAERKARGLPVFTPPQNETMKEKMLNNMGVTSTWTEWFDRAGNAIVGPLYTIHRKATEFYGPESFYTKSTGKLLGSLMAQHALNANNLTFEAIKQGGLQIDDRGFINSTQNEANIVNLNNDYNAIMAAMQRDGMSEAEAYQNAALMLLSDRYKSLIKMGIKAKEEFSSEAMAEAGRLKQQYAKEFDQWRNRYNAMRKNKEDFLVDSGVYTREDAKKLLDRLEYVPLYRIKDSEGADGVFMQGLLSAKQQQKLQFDTKNYDVADVMTNIALNEMWLYKKAIFNHTANLLVDQVAEMGVGKPMKMKPENDEQTIAYLRDGKINYFRFDDPNDMAMLRAVPVINNWAVKQMRLMGSILRKGITLTPSFIYRQVWQDVERAWVQSGTNQPFMKMLGQSVREQVVNAKKNAESETARALRSRGVIGAVEYQDSFENAIDELFGRDKADRSLMEKAYKKLEYMERLAQNSDMAARAVVYENTLKEINPTTGEKYTPGEAALRAQMMLNYQHRGTSPMLRALLATIPFVNTKLQSEWRLVDALQGKVPGLSKEKAKTILATKLLKMAVLTAAYAMMRSGDDDYEEASDENRNRNFLLNVGGVPLRIPVAPEYLLIKSGVEQATRKAIDAEFYEDRKLGHAVVSSIGGLLLGASDVTPAIIRPLLENMTNYSFFNDRALVGQSLQGVATNLQYTDQTSELSKFISNMLYQMGGEYTSISPIKLDNLINGVFGTMGRDVIFLTNQLSDAISGTERPDLKPNQYFEVGTAFYDTKGGQRKADFYNVYDKIDTAYNSYRRLLQSNPEAAREYLQENRQLIALRSPAEAVKNKLDQLRKQRNRISADTTLSGEEKRVRLDRITELENQIVTEPTKRLRERME